MNISTHSITKFILLYLSCMLAMYSIEYVIVGNSISIDFIGFSVFAGLYFVMAFTFRDKLHTFLERTLLNTYINLIIRALLIALHFYIISKLLNVIESVNPDLAFDGIYLIIINLPIFSLLVLRFSNRSTT